MLKHHNCNFQKLTCAILLAALLCVCRSYADTANVVASQDSEIRQASPGSNNGSGPTAVSGRLGNNPGSDNAPRRALFRFELTDAVPPGAIITSASLRLTVAQRPGTPAASTFGMHRIQKSWSESQVTWNASATGDLWTTPGLGSAADALADASSTVLVSASDFPPTTYTFPSTPEMISDVQGWVVNPATNHGWLLKSTGEETLRTARHFATRENTSVGKPTLVIEFDLAASPIVITNVIVSSSNMVFQFTAAAGKSYDVEHSGPAAGGSWMVLTNVPAPGAPEVITVTDALTASNRFYRVRSP